MNDLKADIREVRQMGSRRITGLKWQAILGQVVAREFTRKEAY